MTVRPARSIARVFGPLSLSISALVPTATIRAPLTASACAIVKRPSTVTILPLVKMVSADCAIAAVVHAASMQTRNARKMPRPMFCVLQRFLYRASRSMVIRASRITGPHLSISAFRWLASCSGVELTTTTPRCSSLSLVAVSASVDTVSACIFWIIAGQVLAGTKKANPSIRKYLRVDTVGQRTARKQCLDIVDHNVRHLVADFIDGAAQVRSQHDIGHRQQFRLDERLALEYVEAGTGDAALHQRSHQGFFVDHRSARGVDHIS